MEDGVYISTPDGPDSLISLLGGIGPAPAIVIGYLMRKFGWLFDDTLAFVQSKRYCVSPMSVSVVALGVLLSSLASVSNTIKRV